jgi:pimeloyl-ACP methyl ester carboxylesterase/membrane protein DedA with SNARE-associated domain
MSSARRRRPWLALALGLWAVLLAASHVVRRLDGGPPALADGEREVSLPVHDGHDGERTLAERGRVVYLDRAGLDEVGTGADLPLLLLHGSPGSKADFDGLVATLGPARRVIAPDLPGFGASQGSFPDYSARAHAAYVAGLLAELGIERAHVVGFSMGGAVALELTDLAPERVASLTLLSSLGVQELELFGDYRLNHALHGLQLAFLWGLVELVPHFGLLDRTMLSVPYARNFFDTDQRPLRARLSAWEGPTLVLHGEGDPLVPLQAARESRRLVPQSELVLLPGSHFALFTAPETVARELRPFLERVETGTAPTRAQASPERLAEAARPYEPRDAEPLSGFPLVVFALLAALGTLASEDLTCIGVGALVGEGRVPFWAGAAACFAGIYIGDVLLFLAGRTVGRRALSRAPLRWFLSEERVARASAWFQARGPAVIFLSRFLPGMRLPTYFASGVLRTSFWKFSLWFALAAGLWTPVLVGISSRMGGELTERVRFLQDNVALSLLATVLCVFLLVRILRACLTHRGRRLLVSSARRLVRWEYWPRWAVYPPVVLGCVLFGLRRRSFLAFTASNPAIPRGGVVGESKRAILDGLARSAQRLPRTAFLDAIDDPQARLARAKEIRRAAGLELPLVLKPDVGERGDGVRILRTEEDFERAVRGSAGAQLLQEFVAGEEYGLLWARRPDEARGRLLSIAEKKLPFVVGDGRTSLEGLILADPRHIGMARFFLERHAGRLAEVPRAGERVLLGELGTHCRGATFLDGEHLRTRELEDAVEAVATGFEGFNLGRFDVRAESDAALRSGSFTVLELNGVTAEPAHVYDPRHSVLVGWRALLGQWALAYEIGAANRARGARVSSLGELLSAWRRARALQAARRRAERNGA